MKRILLILTTLHFVLRRWRPKPKKRSIPGAIAAHIPNAYVRQVDHIEDENGNPIVFNVPEGMTVTYFEFTLPSMVDAYRHPDSPHARLTLPVAPHANHLRLN